MIPLLLGLAQAADFDHDYAALDAFYEGAVSDKGIDYGTLATRRDPLKTALRAIESAPVDSFSTEQKLALYINAYNAWTLHTVLEAMPIDSIMELDGGKVWDTRKFTVGGAEYTLNELENTRIRPLGDARIHAAVNCASEGCPPLSSEPIRAETLDAQLTAAAKTWAATNAWRIEGGTVHLSQVFDWYAKDFAPYVEGDLDKVGGKAEAALYFLADFEDEADRERLLSGTLDAAWTPYDWNLNQR